ncbi:ABC transporter permease [Spirochaetota bacterium]
MSKKNMSIVIKLAWRNVWKNKRRTILTLLTILVGSAMILFMNAFAKGGHDQMIEDAVKTNTGHIQIHEKGFWENNSLEYAFKIDPSLLSHINENPKIDAFSIRIHANALLSYKNNTTGAIIQAVQPDKEKNISTIHKNILKGGRYLKPQDLNNIVMGKTLAKNLGVEVGDTVSIISQGFDGSIAAEDLVIVGMFKSGNPEYDRALIIMNIEQAKKTFSMMGFVNSITLRVKNFDKLNDVRDELRSKVDTKKIEVMSWEELMPELVQFIVMDDISAYIFDVVLYLLVAFGILNTIQMSVYERIREFGVMLSIGTKPSQVRSMIIVESIFITIIGIVLGIAVGSALSIYFAYNPLSFADYADEMSVWGVSTIIYPAKLTSLNLSLTVLLTFITSIIFTIFPARRASKLKPIDAIRHL